MSGLFDNGGPLEGLFEFLSSQRKSCSDCDEEKEIPIGELDTNEREEWNSLYAVSSNLHKQFRRLIEEKEVVDARRKIFWGKLRIKYDSEREDKLSVKNNLNLVKLVCSSDNCKKSK